MQKQYYQDYYTLERTHWWFVARMQIIEDLIRRKIYKELPLKILNIGTATGAGTVMMQQFGNVTSVEYDRDCCNFLNNDLKISTINASITELPFADNTFDLVCAFDVIEHVEDHQLAAQEMKRVCKKEGYLFLTVPAYQFLWSEHDVINQHCRRYRAAQLKHLFTTINVTVIKQSYFNFWFFLPIAVIRILLWPFQKNKLQKKPQQEAKSDFGKFNNGIINKICYRIFISEKYLLRFMNFPFGVSNLLLMKK
jgi:SAM-dependent methyltransferase